MVLVVVVVVVVVAGVLMLGKVLDQQVERGLVLVGGNVRDAEDVLQQTKLRGEFLHQQDGVPHGVRFWVKLPPPGRGEE